MLPSPAAQASGVSTSRPRRTMRTRRGASTASARTPPRRCQVCGCLPSPNLQCIISTLPGQTSSPCLSWWGCAALIVVFSCKHCALTTVPQPLRQAVRFCRGWCAGDQHLQHPRRQRGLWAAGAAPRRIVAEQMCVAMHVCLLMRVVVPTVLIHCSCVASPETTRELKLFPCALQSTACCPTPTSRWAAAFLQAARVLLLHLYGNTCDVSPLQLNIFKLFSFTEVSSVHPMAGQLSHWPHSQCLRLTLNNTS